MDSEREKDPLIVRFSQGVLWSLAGTVGFRLFFWVTMVITARILGQVGFGELGIIQRTMDCMLVFGSLGVGMTTSKYVAEFKNLDPPRTGRIIGLTYLISWITGGVLALLCFFAAPWLSTHALNAPHLCGPLRLVGLLLLISSIYRLQNGILAGLQSFQVIARINFWEGLATILITTALAYFAGLWGVVLSFTLVALLRVMLSCSALAREYRYWGILLDFRQSWQERQVLWQFSLPYLLITSLNSIVNWAAYALLANQSQGYAQLGLFNAGMQFQWLVSIFSMIMVQVSLPMFAELYGEGKMDLFTKGFSAYLKVNWQLAMAGGCLAVGLSPWLVYLYGGKFQGTETVLGFIMCFTVFMVAWNINLQPFYSSGKIWHSLVIQIFWSLALLGTGKFLIPLYGAVGLAVAFLIAYALALVLQMITLKYVFGRDMASGIYPVAALSFFLALYVFFKNKIPYSQFHHLLLIIIAVLVLLKLFIDNRKHIIKILINYFPFLSDKFETIA